MIDLAEAIAVTAQDVAAFREQGFLIKERVLNQTFVDSLRGRFPRLF